MKKLITLIIIGVLVWAGYTNFDTIQNTVSTKFLGLFDGFEKDFKQKNDLARSGYSEISVQAEIDRLKKQKASETSVVDKKIAEKESQLRQIVIDKNLTISQKKSRTELIQKDINTLRAQREKIEDKYRNLIRETRF